MFYQACRLRLLRKPIWTFLVYKYSTFFAAFFFNITPSFLFDLLSIQGYPSPIIPHIPAHTYPLSMASNANKYTIYHLDQDGLLTGKYDHTDGRATCLIDSTNIAWAILKMDIVKAAFVTIAEKHCDEYPTSWFLQDREGTRAAKINNVTVEFLKTILIPKFPTLYISDRMRHLDVLGAIHRDDWEDTFSISSERMSLNGRVSRKPPRSRRCLAS